MRRLLMNTAVYQRAAQLQAVTQAESRAKTDLGNKLLASFPPRRIEAEVLRDAIAQPASEPGFGADTGAG